MTPTTPRLARLLAALEIARRHRNPYLEESLLRAIKEEHQTTGERDDCYNAPSCSQRDILAAEIRALRDWLVPEEPEPKRTLNIEPERDVVFIGAWQIWNERRRMRALLLAEADRAERGEP